MDTEPIPGADPGDETQHLADDSDEFIEAMEAAPPAVEPGPESLGTPETLDNPPSTLFTKEHQIVGERFVEKVCGWLHCDSTLAMKLGAYAVDNDSWACSRESIKVTVGKDIDIEITVRRPK